MTHRVLVSDTLSEAGLEVFRAAPGITLEYHPGLSKDALATAIAECDALAVRSATQVTKEILGQSPKLKVIGRAGVGVDNIDVAEATRQGVLVMNAPSGNAVSAAEHAIALMFALARHVPQANASTKSGGWEKSKFKGVELYRKTLGIIGLGNIGRIVLDRARGLKMNVIGHDPTVSPEQTQALGAQWVELDELLKNADVVTLHVPLLESTRHLIDERAVGLMRRGALLINAARGGVVDETAVARAVREGFLGGAAFDVYADEPLLADSPLRALDRVILTPHIAAATEAAQDNVAIAIAEQIVDFLKHGRVQNGLNTDGLQQPA